MVDGDRGLLGGQGQIVDVSMTEGLAYLGSFVNFYKHIDQMWQEEYATFSGHNPIYRWHTRPSSID